MFMSLRLDLHVRDDMLGMEFEAAVGAGSAMTSYNGFVPKERRRSYLVNDLIC